MANQNVRQSKKKRSPYWNVGFCKFGDSCRKNHATSDCTETSCERKTCGKRHRNHCRFKESCKHFKKRHANFLHSDNKRKHADLDGKKLQEYKSEIETLKLEAKHI